MQQVYSSRSNRGMARILTHSMDVPDWVLNYSPMPLGATIPTIELEQQWQVIQGTNDVVYHLCLVAAGMAPRPRRPERETIFRPFSSRDAHVMLQLKPTKEVASGNHVKRLLEYALRSGKAARNIQVVPTLDLLRQYGTGDSKYSTVPPRVILARVSNDVIVQAILPLVAECLESVNASSEKRGDIIARFRIQAEGYASTKLERAWIRKRLHRPTMALRTGRLREEDVAHELKTIERELFRSRSVVPK